MSSASSIKKDKTYFFNIIKKFYRLVRGLFKTNNADWYCKYLEKGARYSGANDPCLSVEYGNSNETIQWIKMHSNDFPWIYNPMEIESAGIYRHLYPSLRYRQAIIGYAKIAVGTRVYIDDYENDFVLKNDEAFIYDTFILPEYRKRHLGDSLLKNILNRLGADGASFVFCHIPEWNLASSRLYRNNGFRLVSNVRYLRLYRFRYFTNKPYSVIDKGRKLFLL